MLGLSLYFTAVDPVTGQQDKVIFSDSAALSLSYTSFGLVLLPAAAGSTAAPVITATLFGSPTPTSALPTTGSATYAGSVAGLASAGSLVYVLTGNASLSANFGAGSYTTSFTFSGKDIAGSSASLPSQSYSGSNGYTLNGSPLNGSLTGANGTTGSGSWNGNFFGPQAQEFGYTFGVTGNGYGAVGAVVGKKQ